VTRLEEAISEERLFEIALEAGAEDVSSESDDAYEIYAAWAIWRHLPGPRGGLDSGPLGRDLAHSPDDGAARADDAVKLMRLLEALEEQDDVSEVLLELRTSPKETMEGLREE